MWIMLLCALVVLGLCVLIVGPDVLRRNRSESYDYYRQCSSAYKKDKKYYKIFPNKKED